MPDFPPDESSDDTPLHSVRRRRIIRAIAMVSMAALVVPSAIGTIVQARASAVYACNLVGASVAPDALAIEPRFRLTPISAAGWQCFAVFFDGTEVLIATLGPIPGLPKPRPTSTS